jgi:hypothetical protein
MLAPALHEIDSYLPCLRKASHVHFLSNVGYIDNYTLTLKRFMLDRFGLDPVLLVVNLTPCLVHQHGERIVDVPLGRLIKHHAASLEIVLGLTL